MQEFGDDFITITDEDGQEYELEVLMRVEYEGAEYLGVCPAGLDDDAEIEVSVLKVVFEDGEEVLCAVQDDEELEAVYALMLEEDEEEI